MRLKVEALILGILMTIFFSNFVNGALEAVAPDLKMPTILTITFAVIIVACSGSFTGRAARSVTLKVRP